MATSYTIGEHYEQFIKQMLDSGRYSTASEVMRDSLRMLEEREAFRQAKLEALRAEIQKGIDSGPPESIEPGTLIDNVKKRGRQRLAAAKHGK